jgi:hypothetical protein
VTPRHDPASPARGRTEAAALAAAGRPEGLLRLLAAATFLIFFQAFMIAPILPVLGRALSAGTGTVSLAVPAYLIPYGVATLLWGPLSDRAGRAAVILGSMTAFVVLTAATGAFYLRRPCDWSPSSNSNRSDCSRVMGCLPLMCGYDEIRGERFPACQDLPAVRRPYRRHEPIC